MKKKCVRDQSPLLKRIQREVWKFFFLDTVLCSPTNPIMASFTSHDTVCGRNLPKLGTFILQSKVPEYTDFFYVVPM